MRQTFLDFLDKAAVELFGMTSDRGTLEESLAGTSVVESAMVLDSGTMEESLVCTTATLESGRVTAGESTRVRAEESTRGTTESGNLTPEGSVAESGDLETEV